MLSALHESIREPNAAFISPQRLARALNINATRLSEGMGVHRNTLRNPQSEALQAKMRDIARIVDRAERLLGGRERAVYWLHNQPLADFGGMTAWEIVAGGHPEAVSMYLDDFDNGPSG